MKLRETVAGTFLTIVSIALSAAAEAHCDSLDGPVARDAQAALEKRDPTVVLKWVSPDREQEVRDVFAQTLAVRSLGTEARQLADRHFFETLVRVHRAGEGEAFTGLKEAGTVDPAIAVADRALQADSSAVLAKEVTKVIDEGIRRRFDLALQRKRHAADSVEAGRAYVEAYVDYVHFVESAHHLGRSGASHKHSDAE